MRRVVYVNCNERDSHFSHPWEAEEEKDDDDDDDDNSGGDNDDDNDNGKDDDYDDADDDDDDDNSDGTTDTDADADESNKGKEKNKRDDKNLIDLVSVGLPELAAAAGDGEGLTNLFSPGDVVILDDLQTLTKSVEHLINYGAHHYQLVVFVVTQTCLGSPLYSLLKPVHNVVLLFANNSASNLARHVKNAFFLSSDTREYLGRIFAHAEKNKSTVVLKINSVATSAIHRSVLAFSGVEGLFCRKETANVEDNKDDDDDDDNNRKEKVEEKEEEESEKEEREGERKKVGGRRRLRRPRPASIPRFCTVYPETKYREDMLRGSRRRRVRLPATDFASDEAFVLVPLQNVQEMQNAEGDDDDDDDDEDEDDDHNGTDGQPNRKKKRVCQRRRWDEMNEQLENEIETGFEFVKWNAAKSLMRELLKCPRVCISADYRLAYVDTREFSIIDFLQVATRKAGPNEGRRRRKNGEDNFVSSFAPLLAVLLANHAPASYIKNKMLYNLAVKLNKNKVGGGLPRPSPRLRRRSAVKSVGDAAAQKAFAQ